LKKNFRNKRKSKVRQSLGERKELRGIKEKDFREKTETHKRGNATAIGVGGVRKVKTWHYQKCHGRRNCGKKKKLPGLCFRKGGTPRPKNGESRRGSWKGGRFWAEEKKKL